jgi:hypothetical protein
MKSLGTAFLGILGLAILGGNAVGAEECAKIGREVREAVKKDAAEVLVIVEAALQKDEGCVCEIVKGAINASGADKNEELLKQIVITALTAVEAEAATIAECAVAAAPESAAAVKEAMRVALGGGGEGNGSGKQPVGDKRVEGKEVVSGEADGEEEPWLGRPISVGGVYLIAPVAPSAALMGRVEIQDLPAADDAEGAARTTTTPAPVSSTNGVLGP